VNDAGDPVPLHDIGDRVAIGDVASDHHHVVKPLRAHDHAETPRIVAQVVHDGPFAASEQSLHHPCADAAERAGHEERHVSPGSR
jgi:hypothetical protein